MAHVVVVTQDPDVRIVLDVFLHCEGHAVMSAGEERHALPALEIGRYPAVVVIHAPTPAHTGLDLLKRATSKTGGQLTRHAYILLTTHQSAISSVRRSQLARLKARVMELPVDLDDVSAAVADAERELHARECRAPAAKAAHRLSH